MRITERLAMMNLCMSLGYLTYNMCSRIHCAIQNINPPPGYWLEHFTAQNYIQIIFTTPENARKSVSVLLGLTTAADVSGHALRWLPFSSIHTVFPLRMHEVCFCSPHLDVSLFFLLYFFIYSYFF